MVGDTEVISLTVIGLIQSVLALNEIIKKDKVKLWE